METKLSAILCVLFIIDFTGSESSEETLEYKEKLDPIDYDDEDESFRNSESRAIYNPDSIPKRRHVHDDSNEDMVEISGSLINLLHDLKASKRARDPLDGPSTIASPVLQIIKSKNLTKLTKGSALTSKLPFAVSIQKKGIHYATGVLVSRNWVLSSAKEFYYLHKRSIRETIKLLRMRIGTVDCKRGGQLIPIKLIEIFPLYVYGSPNYDISLLKLATPIKQYDEVHPINWTDKDLSIFVVLYWPRVVLNGRKVPTNAPERIKYNNIRVSTQDTIPWKKCVSMLQHTNLTLAKSSLCLKPIQTLHSQCMADAGAPVLSYTGLLGVTSSWNSPICRKNPKESPVVVTRISSPQIRAWMKSILLQKKPRLDEEMYEIETV